MAIFIPNKIRAFLDSELSSEIKSKVVDGSDTYYLINQWNSEGGGQILLREDGLGQVSVIAADTVVLPGAASKVPKAVAEKLAPFSLAGKRRLDDEYAEPIDLTGLTSADLRALLLKQAKLADGKLDTDVPGTDGGALACAWAVNEVARRAFGRPIGGGLSTIAMYEVLEAKHHKVTAEDAALAGMVIISPTHGSRIGHVGILGDIPQSGNRNETLIYSNRSSLHQFGHYYTLEHWKQYYGHHQSLPVDFFDPDPAAFEDRVARARMQSLDMAAARVPGLKTIVDFYPGDARNPDFRRIAQSGIVAVIHKATDPLYSFNDQRFHSRRTAARQAGLLWGSYHFGRAGDGVEQADYYLDAAAPQEDEIICLDFEKDDNRPDTVMSVQQAIRFVRRIQDKLHKPPLLYAGHYLRELLDGHRQHPLTVCPIWFADYRPHHPAPELPAPWPTWAIWQYAGDVPEHSSGGVPSLEKCDRNSFNGSLQQLKDFWTSSVQIQALVRHRSEVPEEDRAKELYVSEDLHADPYDNRPPPYAAAAQTQRWRAAKCLLALRDQVNQMAPSRNKSSDGIIGDIHHCGGQHHSDHCPNVADGNVGVVTALDITHDPAHGCDSGQLVEAIRASRDSRIKYLIWNRRIANSLPQHGQPAWAWREYSGSNPHDRHCHISVKPIKDGPEGYDTTSAWSIRQEEMA